MKSLCYAAFQGLITQVPGPKNVSVLSPIGDPSNLVAELELPSSGRLTTLNILRGHNTDDRSQQ